MSKRILAVVLALVMATTLLSVNVFAALNPTIGQEGSDKTAVRVSWQSVNNASYYKVQLFKDGLENGTPVTVTPNSDNSNLYKVFQNLSGGTYTASVSAYTKNNTIIEALQTSGNVSIAFSGGTSGYPITIPKTTGTFEISWPAYTLASGESGEVTYEVEYGSRTAKGAANPTRSATPQNGGKDTKVTLELGEDILTSVTVYYKVGNSARKQLTTTTVSSSGSTGSTGVLGFTTSGNVGYSNGYLTWTGSNYVSIQILVGGSQYGSTISWSGTQYYIGNTINQLLAQYSYYPIQVIVTDLNTRYRIGTLSYTGYGYGAYGALSIYSVQPYVGTGYAEVTWSAVANAASYVVNYSVNGGTQQSIPASTNSAQVPWTYGQQVSISVWAIGSNNSVIAQSGTAVISQYGQVSYANNNTGLGNLGSNGVQGNNCVLYVGANSTTVQLLNYNSYNPNSTFAVVTVNGSNNYTTPVYSNPFSINVGSGSSFTLIVISNGQTIASATYNATSSDSSLLNSNSKTSYTRGLRLTAKNSNTTTVDWDPVPNASNYEVQYVRTGLAGSVVDQYTTKTTFDIPLGKSVGFEVIVYAYVNNRPREVGEALHIAGDDVAAANTSSNSTTSSNKSAYVTGLKGTVGTSGSITLSWNAASGNPNYDIYYKKSTASKWTKVYTTTGRALKINKLSNGTSYDFKVVANDRDSGILTMTIGTTSSTKTAPDPAGSGTTTSSVPVITSISGGTGSITVSWSAVSGAVKYQVWVNKAGTTTYTKKATVDGTSATVTGLDSGSYKVRIKASKDGTTWYTFNDSKCIKSDYRTVDVK